MGLRAWSFWIRLVATSLQVGVQLLQVHRFSIFPSPWPKALSLITGKKREEILSLRIFMMSSLFRGFRALTAEPQTRGSTA